MPEGASGGYDGAGVSFDLSFACSCVWICDSEVGGEMMSWEAK